MAGHSQFANIKHRKGAQDAKRSQKFTKLIREIIVAAKQGLPNPEFNPRLRSAIFAARKENLPKDKIETAIKSISNPSVDNNYEEVQYEGYGPSGLAFIIYALTNNRNRTASELRYIFSRYGGILGETGSVNFLFDHIGLVVYKAGEISFDDIFNYSLELGVLDVEGQQDFYNVICEVKDFGKVRDALYEKFAEPEYARLAWKAKDLVTIDDEGLVKRVIDLVEVLENNDDIQYLDNNFTYNVQSKQ
ncbi:YebC/PmpR family DNA-binding transcriptional regulator [Candidatus Mesenet endosymbiont of Agriotes lineatus]|uniref:YebC/PmpR family DNA-binding transcriptional regulator n=1 Tax=Candidatus Mesenet endosymbiont of Agriotes lineatus TaxID=3077948 RepID=UPI0030CCB070